MQLSRRRGSTSLQSLRRQLLRFFLIHFGKTPKHWLDERRARAAAEEIARGELVKTAASDLKFKKASSSPLLQTRRGIRPKNHGIKPGDVPNR